MVQQNGLSARITHAKPPTHPLGLHGHPEHFRFQQKREHFLDGRHGMELHLFVYLRWHLVQGGFSPFCARPWTCSKPHSPVVLQVEREGVLSFVAFELDRFGASLQSPDRATAST